jgi:hypothetical protein
LTGLIFTLLPAELGFVRQVPEGGIFGPIYSNMFAVEYRKYKRCSQSIPGQVPEEKCTSARWCAGSRGANPDYFALLTIYSALL